jgi:hypothetical protein
MLPVMGILGATVHQASGYLQGFDPSNPSLDYAVSGHWYIYT